LGGSLEFCYPVLSRARPLRQQQVLRTHRAEFAGRKAPLPDWLVKPWAGGGVVGCVDVGYEFAGMKRAADLALSLQAAHRIGPDAN
jgi:hypothetical protein